MLAYASLIKNEAVSNFESDAVGVHFSCAEDPTDAANKVLKVLTKNTRKNLNSTTSIAPHNASPKGTTYEFEMKYYFERIPWLYDSPRYLSLEFRNDSGDKILGLFITPTVCGEGVSSSELGMYRDDGSRIEGITLNSERWYRIKLEYYYDRDDIEASRMKIYLAEENGALALMADLNLYSKQGSISRFALVHSATKIRGIQYLDDISFTKTDKKYSPSEKDGEAGPGSSRITYDFENGIPSDEDFRINMVHSVDDSRITYDPAKRRDGDSVILPSRDFYEILLVTTGGGSFYTDGLEYPLNPGCIFIVPPGKSYAINSAEKYKIISIKGDFDQFSFIETVYALYDNVYKEGRNLAELILFNRFGDDDYVEKLCDAYVKFLLLNLNLTPKNTTASVYKIINEMQKRFGDSDLSIHTLLGESGYAIDYIRYEFRLVTNSTPAKYLANIRMKNARMMINLHGKDASMSEIAEKCGFLDLSVFSRLFKKHFGMSPSQYKKSLEKQ